MVINMSGRYNNYESYTPKRRASKINEEKTDRNER